MPVSLMVTIPRLPILGLQLARQNQTHHFSVPFQRFQKPADDVMSMDLDFPSVF